MADVKISQLPAATTPVDGTEVLPIVQSATTKQVSIANLTAGRAMSASSLTLTNPLAVTSGGTGLATTAAGTLLSSTALNTISATATPTLGVAGTTAGTLGLSGSTSGVVTLATAAAAGTWTFTLPTSGGSNNWILTTNGSGVTQWTNPTALGIDLDVGTTAITGGTTGRVLYDNAGVLGEYTAVPVGFGGTGTSTAFTAGSVVFAGASGVYSQNNSNLFWDNSLNALAIGTTSTDNSHALKLYAASSPRMNYQNSGTGVTATDGFEIGINASNQAFLWNYENTDLYFGTNNTERMRITSGGLVGIGTSSPDAAFTTTFSGLYGIRIQSADTNNSCINIGSDTGNGYAFIDASKTGTGTLLPLRFSTGDNERMRLDTSGNLGLGVTPSAWGAGYKALDLNTYGSIQGTTGGLNVTGNAFHNGSSWAYKLNGAATLYATFGGQHTWWNAPSGTAGNAISFTQAMTLDASGNLGVGTTSPNGRVHARQDSAGGTTYPLIADNGAGGAGTNVAAIAFQNAGTQKASIRAAVYGNGYMTFHTDNDTEKMRIDSSGNLLVAKTSASTTTAGFQVGNTEGANITRLSIGGADSSSATALSIYSTSATAFRFYVSYGGTVFATNTSISAISDQRVKENIRDLDVGLDAILSLKPRKFDWKEGKGANVKDARGFIAQEFEQVFPDLVDEWKDAPPEGEEPYKSVRADLMPVVVKAIQELAAEVAALKGQLNA